MAVDSASFSSFFDALVEAATGNDANRMFGCPAAKFDHWKAECISRGLIDAQDKPNVIRAMLSKYKLELIAANWIACNDTMAWVLA